MSVSKSEEVGSSKVEALAITDVGMVREHNEDSSFVDPRGTFFIVADGMGGHAAGEVASSMAVDTVRKKLENSRTAIRAFARSPTEQRRRDLVQLLQNSVLAAHEAVFQRGTAELDKQGMGTTLDVVLLAGSEAFVAHVGDSRTYLIRKGKASQVTTDHTVAEVLVIEGKLSIEEAQHSTLRNVLVNAIGVSREVGVEMAHLQLRVGDRLLLCSDGLHEYFLAEEEIGDRLSVSGPGALAEALRVMVELAKERGGHDNITGVIVGVLELPNAIPSTVERDQTQPVDVPAVAQGEWEDEHTEGSGAAHPKLDLGTRPTLEFPALQPDTLPFADEATPNPVVRRSEPLRAIRLPEAIHEAVADERRRVIARADTVPPDPSLKLGKPPDMPGEPKADGPPGTSAEPARADRPAKGKSRGTRAKSPKGTEPAPPGPTASSLADTLEGPPANDPSATIPPQSRAPAAPAAGTPAATNEDATTKRDRTSD